MGAPISSGSPRRGGRRRRLVAPVVVILAGLLAFAAGWMGANALVADNETAKTPGSTAPQTATTHPSPETTAPSTVTTDGPTSTGPQRETTSSTEPPSGEPRPPATDPPAGGREYARLPTEERVIALTFDASYDPAPLSRILEILDGRNVPATFFLTGEFAERFPDEVRAIDRAGHPIGNHSYSHPDFTELDAGAIADQLDRTADRLQGLGVRDPRPLFRPPFGARDPRVLTELAREGYVSVYWTIDTLDWKPERTVGQITSTVLERAVPGAIVLMHVGGAHTAAALPEIIQGLDARGYRFVTLEQYL